MQKCNLHNQWCTFSNESWKLHNQQAKVHFRCANCTFVQSWRCKLHNAWCKLHFSMVYFWCTFGANYTKTAQLVSKIFMILTRFWCKLQCCGHISIFSSCDLDQVAEQQVTHAELHSSRFTLVRDWEQHVYVSLPGLHDQIVAGTTQVACKVSRKKVCYFKFLSCWNS